MPRPPSGPGYTQESDSVAAIRHAVAKCREIVATGQDSQRPGADNSVREQAMRKTTDTKTGKTFRWNTTIVEDGLLVPARRTSRGMAHLPSDRVLPGLLWQLNRNAIDHTEPPSAPLQTVRSCPRDGGLSPEEEGDGRAGPAWTAAPGLRRLLSGKAGSRHRASSAGDGRSPAERSVSRDATPDRMTSDTASTM
jgi:hypothetical protein